MSSTVTQPALLVQGYYAVETEAEISDVNHIAKDVAALLNCSNKGGGRWQSETTLVRFFRLPAPAAHDTAVLQIVFNQANRPEVSWHSLRQQLQQTSEAVPKLFNEAGQAEHLWGYSLIYQGCVSDQATLDTFADFTATRLLHDDKPLTSLTDTVCRKGRLWLLDVPNQGAGIAAATVYVALSLPEDSRDFTNHILFHKGAALLIPDLVAHKGYFQMRQYRTRRLPNQENPRPYHRQLTKQLDDTIGAVLDYSPETPHVVKPNEITDSLKRVSSEYAALLSTTTILEDVQLALRQQIENFRWWHDHKVLGEGGVLPFHSQQLHMADRDLTLLIGKARGTLQAAQTTISVMEAQTNQRQVAQQQSLQVWLAIIAAALAVPQIVDRDLAGELLTAVGSSYAGDVWAQLAIQLLVTIFIGLLFGWRLIRQWLSRLFKRG